MVSGIAKLEFCSRKGWPRNKKHLLGRFSPTGLKEHLQVQQSQKKRVKTVCLNFTAQDGRLRLRDLLIFPHTEKTLGSGVLWEKGLHTKLCGHQSTSFWSHLNPADTWSSAQVHHTPPNLLEAGAPGRAICECRRACRTAGTSFSHTEREEIFFRFTAVAVIHSQGSWWQWSVSGAANHLGQVIQPWWAWGDLGKVQKRGGMQLTAKDHCTRPGKVNSEGSVWLSAMRSLRLGPGTEGQEWKERWTLNQACSLVNNLTPRLRS